MPLPLVIEPSQLAAELRNPALLILDLSSEDNYQLAHIPGAVRVDPGRLLCGQQPVPNKLPDSAQLSALFSELGLSKDRHVVVYDDQNGALAGRMIWTLHCVGHTACSFLNGLLHSWKAADLPLETTATTAQHTDFQAQINSELVADIPFINSQQNNPDSCIWDARSRAEYDGEKVVNAQKGGHIPGASWFEWTDALDLDNHLRLKPRDTLLALLAAQGITPDKHIITHCQTHRRSGLTYLVACYLGFEHVRCYDGSWFEWGNHPDTPVER